MKDIHQIRRKVVERLREVIDPELGVNIVDLGLIYQIFLEEEKLRVDFTTTTPGCPLRRYLHQQVEKALQETDEIGEFEINILMKPDWRVEMIKEGVDFFAVPPPSRN